MFKDQRQRIAAARQRIDKISCCRHGGRAGVVSDADLILHIVDAQFQARALQSEHGP